MCAGSGNRNGMKVIALAACLTLWCVSAFGQSNDAKFEVASVRPSTEATTTPANSWIHGGPGTKDPERIEFKNISLKVILMKVYALQDYQISAPEWTSTTRVNVVANVPPGATAEQLPAMLRNLLVERFNLAVHRETKDMTVYELTVGKNGSKLQTADLTVLPPEREPGSRPPTIGKPDSAGFPQIPPGVHLMGGRITNGIMRWTARAEAVADLANLLGSELERPVLDKTELSGKYDFSIAYSRIGLRQWVTARGPIGLPEDDAPSGGPTLQKAVEDQLGLKLDLKKDPIYVVVIDRLDKVPTEN
jgi:uncharacterized protein (TIGR03435 family)